MDEHDLRQMEELMGRMMGQFRGEIIEAFDQRLGIMAESVQHKLDLLVEGQQGLGERMDRLEGRMDGLENRLERVELKVVVLDKKVDGLEQKVDGVAANLDAHRRDTEAHRGWRVREE